MKSFRRTTGRVAVLDRADVDTDQIVPKQFLKSIERTGFGETLFYEWMKDPEFELNRPEYRGAKVLIAGANFGCGSSREHAAWALEDYGFEVVIAPSFSDIFRSNATKIGLVPIVLPEAQVRELMDAFRDGGELTVDLDRQWIFDDQGRELKFDFDPFQRECILEGLDDIALALVHEHAIDAYEAAHAAPIDSTALPR